LAGHPAANPGVAALRNDVLLAGLSGNLLEAVADGVGGQMVLVVDLPVYAQGEVEVA
jgi:hypothetical protein